MSTLSMQKQVTINELRTTIRTVGHVITSIIVSEPGCGKSSLLPMLAEDLKCEWRKPADTGTARCEDDEYDFIYIDAPLRNVMDMGAYIPDRDDKKLMYYVSELLNLKNGKKKVIMVDEAMKAPKMMQIIFTRLYLERMWGESPLPEGSIVFGTSNNASDNLGDSMLGHGGNRVVFYYMQKPRAKPWLVWAADKKIHRIIRSCVMMNPRWLASYQDGGQEDNPVIFKPNNGVLSFVSPRSLAGCDVFLKNKDVLGQDVLYASLQGTIGLSAASMMMAFIDMEKELLQTQEVIADPLGVMVPEKPAAIIHMMINACDDIQTQDELVSFMQFVDRIKSEELKMIFCTLGAETKRTMKLFTTNGEVRKLMAKNIDIF